MTSQLDSTTEATALTVFWHDTCLLHDAGAGHFEAGPSPLLVRPEPHPEGADRLANMRSALERGPLAGMVRWRSGRYASRQELALFHDRAHIDSIARFQALREPTHIEGPTWASAKTWDAARAAAGSAISAARAVIMEETAVAYALVRPPGHHAAPDRTDGGCFFNNAALAASAALLDGVSKVAIVDFDAHHGNGTQAGFYERDDVLTISIHMNHGSWDSKHHPETGLTAEIGRGAGAGYNLNIPLPLGSGDDGYRAVIEALVLPALARYEPALIVCAAGQDAGQVDPNGRQCVTLDGFHAIGQLVSTAANELCDGRIVLTQEGGYAKTHAAFGLLATLCGILGQPHGIDDPYAYLPDQGIDYRSVIDEVRRGFSRAPSDLL